MLLWFALDNSKRLRAVEGAIDRMARVNLLHLVANPATPPAIRNQATEIQGELNRKKAREDPAVS